MLKKHIPNTITCCNLVSGCIATYWAFQSNYGLALLFIVIGAVFDFFDGMTARLLHVSSPIGKELDSLADDITFGFVPSAIIFGFLQSYMAAANTSLLTLHSLLPYLAFVMAAFSALRLAKFNLDERQALGFIGLPTPANALFWGSLIVGLSSVCGQTTEHSVLPVDSDLMSCLPYILLFMMFVSCWLLVSEIPMFALKFKHWGWKENRIKYFFLITSALILAFFGIIGIAVVIAWYVALSILTHYLTNNK